MYLGQAEDPSVLTEVTGELFKQLLPSLVGPAKEVGAQIATAVKPMVREELNRQVPKFAVYSGLAFGAMLLVGVGIGLLTTKERRKGTAKATTSVLKKATGSKWKPRMT